MRLRGRQALQSTGNSGYQRLGRRLLGNCCPTPQHLGRAFEEGGGGLPFARAARHHRTVVTVEAVLVVSYLESCLCIVPRFV